MTKPSDNRYDLSQGLDRVLSAKEQPQGAWYAQGLPLSTLPATVDNAPNAELGYSAQRQALLAFLNPAVANRQVITPAAFKTRLREARQVFQQLSQSGEQAKAFAACAELLGEVEQSGGLLYAQRNRLVKA